MRDVGPGAACAVQPNQPAVRIEFRQKDIEKSATDKSDSFHRHCATEEPADINVSRVIEGYAFSDVTERAPIVLRPDDAASRVIFHHQPVIVAVTGQDKGSKLSSWIRSVRLDRPDHVRVTRRIGGHIVTLIKQRTAADGCPKQVTHGVVFDEKNIGGVARDGDVIEETGITYNPSGVGVAGRVATHAIANPTGAHLLHPLRGLRREWRSER